MCCGYGEALWLNIPQPGLRRSGGVASRRKVLNSLLLAKVDIDFNRFDNMKTSTRNKMLEHFESALKRDFVNDEQADSISCPIGGLPDDDDAGIVDGCLVVTREEMKDIFDPVINLIIPLVQDQIDTIEQHNEPALQVSV